ncbi:hypothetical protein ACJ73_07515 [Blastomyces percursus]|uniref:Uncharacterized protein n=1 Tax=Blastomyces percursus TaxID=1658174 RepID=A0A1J9PXT2_9EURO|nr:hypothetical protein ACJ73_07515 [Blastomyces percursus]
MTLNYVPHLKIENVLVNRFDNKSIGSGERLVTKIAEDPNTLCTVPTPASSPHRFQETRNVRLFGGRMDVDR